MSNACDKNDYSVITPDGWKDLVKITTLTNLSAINFAYHQKMSGYCRPKISSSRTFLLLKLTEVTSIQESV